MARMRQGETFTSVRKLLDVVGYGYIAVGIGAVVALGVLAGRPRTALVSRLALAAAIAAGLGVVLELAQRVFITFGSSVGRMERAFEIFGAGMVLAETVEKVLVAVIAVRVGRAVGARALVPVAVGALAASLLAFAMYLLMLVHGREESAHGAAPTIQTVA